MLLPPEMRPLCRELDRERPQVLVVVGAGVSFGATGEGRASWRGLLEHGVETLRSLGTWNDETANANLTLIRNAFTSAFDLDEVLGRAESIAKALGALDGSGYADWLADAIGSLKAVTGRTATLDAIRELEQAGALILTTNYDDLLGEAIGLEAVTWQDHREFLRVLNREREAVLHLHGHWRQPASVILGRRSYQSILATPELQDIFKSIWLHWSWLYVGCGNGLDDPNVGQLLRWGHIAFGSAAPKHFFLAQAGVADALAARPDKPANLIAVGYADHAELPDRLRALTPHRRPQPFVELGPRSGPVRLPTTSPLDIPLPSWQELLDGAVPALAADADVTDSLRRHGWALVYDVASVGKTTLALRLAAGAEYRDRPAFYLDLARIDDNDEEETAALRAAVRRLAHTGALLILDNAHWAPAILRRFWSPTLTGRIGTALAALAIAEGEALGACVQFLGAAQLIGRRLPRAPFAAARLDLIARLPIDVLPHRPEAAAIEPYQRNLWLGLRATASLAPASLRVGQDVIAETLTRWQVSLQESTIEPKGTLHRLNRSMIAWLQASANKGEGSLSPCSEPLWLIPGFGWDPNAS